MSYRVRVYERSDPGRPVVDMALCSQRDVAAHWAGTARLLGLPLISALHPDGFELEGEQLDALAAEVARLREHWATTIVGAETRVTISGPRRWHTPLQQHLDARATKPTPDGCDEVPSGCGGMHMNWTA